jgi:RNA polymerase sigma factor for flagellar operon FliA
VVDKDAPEVLERFETHLDLVEILARQIGRTTGEAVELQDLISYGREGLLDAARRFEAERGVPFRAYANFRVRGAIIDGVRAMSRVPRRVYERVGALAAASRVSEGTLEDLQVPEAPGAGAAQAERALAEHLAAMATAMTLGLLSPTVRGDEGEPTPLELAPSPEDALGRAELLQAVREAVGDLPDDEATLIRRHYFHGERFDQVAEELGLSKSWASRLHTRAIRRLTKRLGPLKP